jgi:hypothetical protein
MTGIGTVERHNSGKCESSPKLGQTTAAFDLMAFLICHSTITGTEVPPSL